MVVTLWGEQAPGGKRGCCISEGLTTLYHPLFSSPAARPAKQPSLRVVL